MQISYSLTTSISYTSLGDEASRTALVESFAPSFTPVNQIEPLFRALNTFKAVRDNVGVSLAILVSIPYATKAAALTAILTLRTAFKVKTHLKIVEGATTHYYPNAVCTGYAPVLKGVTVLHQLNFITDDVTTTAPT